MGLVLGLEAVERGLKGFVLGVEMVQHEVSRGLRILLELLGLLLPELLIEDSLGVEG